MDITRLHRSSSVPRESIKFRVGCHEQITPSAPTTKDWLEIGNILHTSSATMGVLKGVLRRNKHVVVKFGPPALMKKEYDIGELLKKLPNMIRFYCYFRCNESAHRLYRQSFETHAYICSGPGDELGLAVMPFYALGSIKSVHWNASNLGTLKNILLQVCWAMLHAYDLHGFVHGDLHVENVLVRKTKKTELVYGNHRIPIVGGMYAIVMDFERAGQDPGREYPKLVYKDMQKLIHNACCMDGNSDLVLCYDYNKLPGWISDNRPVTSYVYDDVRKLIDGMRISYEKSKVPLID